MPPPPASQEALLEGLEARFGLRNVRADWVRRQSHLTPDEAAGPITRTNLCEITHGTLPWNILTAHSVTLGVSTLVQVDDVINIASPDPRSPAAPRVLQFSLSDGRTSFVGIELTALGARVSLRTVPGTKLVLQPGTLVRRGRALLVARHVVVLGAPPANVWGAAYHTRVADALRAAGLPNPKASSFDAIARAPGAGTAGVDMGGIADALPRTNEDDDDDDDFWAQAVSVADRSVAEATDARVHTQMAHAGAPSLARDDGAREGFTAPSIDVDANNALPDPTPAVTVDALQAPDEVQIVEPEPEPEPEPESEWRPAANLRPPSKRRNLVVEGSDEEGEKVIEIPDVPVFESDPVMEETRRETRPSSSEPIYIASGSEPDADDFLRPRLPLERLCDLQDTVMEGKRQSLYRVCAIKTARKLSIRLDNGRVVIATLVDDGTGVRLFPLRSDLAKRLSGVDHDSPVFHHDVERGGHLIRKSLRGICGFVRVEHENGGATITEILPRGPDRMSEFLSHYADNVEARFAEYTMDTARPA